MNLALSSRILSDPLDPHDARALLDTARALGAAEQAGALQPLLRGKHFALMCDESGCEPAQVFEDAARQLGARVSRIPTQRGGGETPRAALNMLGRLYDAVEFEHASAEAAAQLQRAIGVPVFNGLAAPGHALMRLGDEADRRKLVQAMLLHSIG